MEQHTLAGTDLTIGSVVFGAMTFGSQVEQPEASAMVRACLDAGVTMFDTSNNYAGGASEELLGRLLAPVRDQVVIATKGGSYVDQADQEASGLRRTAIVRAVEGSLRRLGVEHVDVWYFHRPDWCTPIEESLAAIDEVVRSGKVRYVGQSNFAAWQIAEMLWIAEREGWPQVRVSQQLYNLIGRRVEAEYAACAERLGLSTIAYNPLAGGLLTGKHRREDDATEGRFTRQMYRDRYWSDASFAAVEALGRISRMAGLTPVELALRWVRGRPLTDGVLLGASDLGQLEANLAAIDGPPLDDDTVAACDDVWAGLEGPAPHYNR